MPNVRLSEKMPQLGPSCSSGEIVLFGAVPEGFFSPFVPGHDTSTLITIGNCPIFSEPEETGF